MSLGDSVDDRVEGESCVVCGKGLRSGEALATLHREGLRLPICCPLCLEEYEKDPKPYLERLAQRILRREVRKLEDNKA